MNILEAANYVYLTELHCGGPGSGRHPEGGRSKITQAPNGMAINKRTGDYSERNNTRLEHRTRREHIAKKEAQGHSLVKKGSYPNGSIYHILRSPSGAKVEYVTYGNKVSRAWS